MMQMQIPSGLQALMQASQILQQESQPVVQTPAGPQPTVAGQVSQGLQQLAAQKTGAQPQMGGQQQGGPDMRQMGEQAGLAAQLMAQKQQQQQQMAQDPRAVAQMAAQMMGQQQQPGIEGIPFDMQFKEGGIIGFAGPDGSEVPDPEEQQRKSDREAMIETLKKLAAAGYDVSTLIPRGFMGAIESGITRPLRAMGLPIPYLPESAYGGDRSSMTPMMDRLRREPARPAAPPSGLGAMESSPMPSTERGQGKYPVQPTDAAVQQIMANPNPSDEEKRAILEDARRNGIANPAIAASWQKQGAPEAPAAPAPTGIAASLPSEVTKPTMSDIQSGVALLAPRKQTDDRIARLRDIAAQREKAMAEMPDLAAEGITAVEETRREREAIQRKAAEQDTYNRTKAFFRDLATGGGTSYQNVEAAILAREEAARVAKFNESKAILTLKEAQQAKKLGQFDRAEALETKVAGFEDKQRDAELRAAEITKGLETAVYGPQLQYLANMAQIAAQERLRMQELTLRTRELRDAKDRDRLNVANAKVTDALKAWEDVNKNHKMAASMTPQMLKDPNMKALYDKFVEDKSTFWKNSVEPAIRAREAIEREVLGTPASAPAPGGQKPKLYFDNRGNLIQ